MALRSVAIAPVRLARQPARLLVGPVLAAIAGSLAMATGALLVSAAEGELPILPLLLAASGAVLISGGAWMAALLLSIRLDVEIAGLRLRWLGGERRYRLARGRVTRVAIGGADGAPLRARFGGLGWAFGSAVLRDDEEVDVVRLAAAEALVFIPTDRGRLGVAPADERELLDALTAAARVQQRLDEAALNVRPVAVAVSAPASGERVEAPAVRPPPREALQTGPRLMTGIERAMLEERLEAQRVAAAQAAELERRAALEAMRAAAVAIPAALPAPERIRVPVTPAPIPVPPPAVASPPAALPAVATATPALTAVSVPAPSVPALPGEPVIPPAVRRERTPWQRPAWMTLPSIRLPRPSVSLPRPTLHLPRPAVALPPLRLPAALGTPTHLVLLISPALAVAVAGIVLTVVGPLPLLAADGRQLTVAMILGGPLAAAGALLAAFRFPRLAGLVSVSGWLALALLGRALIG